MIKLRMKSILSIQRALFSVNYNKDYYKILGVQPDSSTKDIKSAFRKMVKVHHPDVNEGC